MTLAATASAWLVVGADGYRFVFLERARAEFWASKCSGQVLPLYLEVTP